MTMTDEQIINCALISLKHYRIMLAYFSEEAGTPELFNDANELFEDATQMQRACYEKMIDEGWMSVTAQTDSEIQKAYQKMKKITQEMK